MLRKMNDSEERLLRRLASLAVGVEFSDSEVSSLLVEPMNDGGMGSLRLHPDSQEKELRKLGKRIAELQFRDIDGVVVIASLNLDQNGSLFELDIWKTDFSELRQLPEDF